MTTSPIQLLDQLRDLGVEVRARSGRLQLRPASAVQPALRDELAARQEALVALLSGVDPRTDTRQGGTDRTVRSPARGASVGSGCDQGGLIRHAGEPEVGAPIDWPTPTATCYACGGESFWALRPGLPWVCDRCHPTAQDHDDVEHFVVRERGALTLNDAVVDEGGAA